ncbi:uncharacterized protein LOC119394286 [Rhipicephalus sanguineus]|uniref:uncharacterized protein LOC119394286 n=1 Tax=Rhipicephalus sanguineus TaxID=34632 RepID=UPI0020C5619B|nr:uncharacterized protein LOC119394286 [Rhipicephalus sanguineus]
MRSLPRQAPPKRSPGGGGALKGTFPIPLGSLAAAHRPFSLSLLQVLSKLPEPPLHQTNSPSFVLPALWRRGATLVHPGFCVKRGGDGGAAASSDDAQDGCAAKVTPPAPAVNSCEWMIGPRSRSYREAVVLLQALNCSIALAQKQVSCRAAVLEATAYCQGMLWGVFLSLSLPY